jgi:hypothetical protein
MRNVRAAAAALAAATLLGAGNPASILDSYRDALAKLHSPPFMEFAYTVTRSGPSRIVTEQHQVYWAASGVERNDTIEINGTRVVPAPTQVIHRDAWPYDPAQFAVSPDDYDAAPAGMALVAGHATYAFTLTRSSPADFVLKSLYVDVRRRLPVRQTFAVAGADCEGAGEINFGPVGGYWLPTFVSVACTQTGTDASPPPVFKESIRFSNYQFPASIPADVFVQPASSAGYQSSPGGP